MVGACQKTNSYECQDKRFPSRTIYSKTMLFISIVSVSDVLADIIRNTFTLQDFFLMSNKMSTGCSKKPVHFVRALFLS